jgi:hypothetical protein
MGMEIKIWSSMHGGKLGIGEYKEAAADHLPS